MRTARKLMQCLLISILLISSAFVSKTVNAEESSTWVKVDDIAAAAASDKLVAITMTLADGTVYVLPTAQASAGSQVLAVSATISDGELLIEDSEEAFGWTITSTDDGYTIVSSEENYLWV